MSEFLDAVAAGDTETVGRLLAASPELANERDPGGSHPVQFATYRGQMAARQLIQEANPTLDLAAAAAAGDSRRVKELLAGGADPNEMSQDGFRPLGLASAFGCPECVNALLDAGADPNGFSKAIPVAPLHAAVFGRRHENVVALLGRGADVNLPQESGFTALHGASAHGMAETVQLLLDAGANPDARTEEGKTYQDVAAG